MAGEPGDLWAGAAPLAGSHLEQPIHGLLAHAGALGESARANAIGTGKLQNGNVRQLEVLEPRSVEFLNDAAMDRLSRNAQQCSNEHFACWKR